MELSAILDLRPYPPLLTPKQVAPLLQISEAALRHWRTRTPSRLPHVQDGGRYWYDTATVVAFLSRYTPRPYKRAPACKTYSKRKTK